MVLISACLSHPVALSFIVGKWPNSHWGIQNGTDTSFYDLFIYIQFVSISSFYVIGQFKILKFHIIGGMHAIDLNSHMIL